LKSGNGVTGMNMSPDLGQVAGKTVAYGQTNSPRRD